MTGRALPPRERKLWAVAGAVALSVHLAAGAAALSWVRPAPPRVAEPVVLVELPPPGEERALLTASPSRAASAVTPPPSAALPFEVPPARAPVPKDAVALPPSAPEPAKLSSPAASAPSSPTAKPALANPPAGAGGPVGGHDPAAEKAEADYKALVGSYIRRNRFSPPQSRKAGLSGTVKVRFVVDRRGSISSVSVAGGSGHGMLDGEALSFIQRLTPVPAFPRDLKRGEIPLTISLKFDLERK